MFLSQNTVYYYWIIHIIEVFTQFDEQHATRLSICAEAYLRICSEQLADERRRRISGGVLGLACFVRCFTLSFCAHKTPWTCEKTNYSFRRRCPGAFLSLSRPPGCITCVPQGCLWHGSCHWWGPWGPSCCSEQGGLLCLMDCPLEHGALNLNWVCIQHPCRETHLPLDFFYYFSHGNRHVHHKRDWWLTLKHRSYSFMLIMLIVASRGKITLVCLTLHLHSVHTYGKFLGCGFGRNKLI